MDDSSSPRKKPEPLGPLLAPIIIALLLALGALYVFMERQQQVRQFEVQQNQA